MSLILAAHWVHNLNPFLIRFPEGFPLPGIRWYGMAYLAGFLAAWWLLRLLARKERLGGVRPEEVSDLVFWSAVGAVVGGRLGYSIFYNLQMTLTRPWSIFEVWQGGMASHGGFIGVSATMVLWWSRRLRFPATTGRIAAGEEGHGPRQNLARIENEESRMENLHPEARKRSDARAARRREQRIRGSARVSESVWSRVRTTLRMTGFWRMVDGVAAVTPVGLFFGRVANFVNGELWGRPSELPWAVIFPMSPEPLVPRHPSALYEAALEGLALFAWLFPGALRGKWRAGGAAARFVMGYAVARVLVEFLREPDETIGFQWLGLTRGQWLSVVMAALGVVLLRWVRRVSPAAAPPPPDGE